MIDHAGHRALIKKQPDDTEKIRSMVIVATYSAPNSSDTGQRSEDIKAPEQQSPNQRRWLSTHFQHVLEANFVWRSRSGKRFRNRL